MSVAALPESAVADDITARSSNGTLEVAIPKQPEIQARLYERARSYMVPNRELFREWVGGFDGFLEYTEPSAGAYAFVKYNAEISSIELSEGIRQRQSVLIVPGAWMGMENYLRFSLGTPRANLEEGLRRVGQELRRLRSE